MKQLGISTAALYLQEIDMTAVGELCGSSDPSALMIGESVLSVTLDGSAMLQRL
jgi:hypothetical protein